jgi:hypothetical protein
MAIKRSQIKYTINEGELYPATIDGEAVPQGTKVTKSIVDDRVRVRFQDDNSFGLVPKSKVDNTNLTVDGRKIFLPDPVYHGPVYVVE